jgi:rhodanese-related sulfurtransferase
MTSEKALMTLLLSIVFIFALSSISVAVTGVKMIDTAQLHSMVVDNAYRIEGGREWQFTVIDARSKEEYDEAHIFSAISVPEEDFEKSTALLPKDKGALLLVYCNDMKSETGIKWADKAGAAGYTNIAIYSEGFTVWKEKQMPIAPLTNKRRNQK